MINIVFDRKYRRSYTRSIPSSSTRRKSKYSHSNNNEFLFSKKLKLDFESFIAEMEKMGDTSNNMQSMSQSVGSNLSSASHVLLPHLKKEVISARDEVKSE